MTTRSAKRFCMWLVWTVVYLFRNRWRREDFGQFMLRTTRCWKPWRTFRPSVFRNDEGNEWEIYLTHERSYVECRTIDVEVHIGQESGNIVGLTVWDEMLKQKDEVTSSFPDKAMERACVTAHRKGQSRPLEEYIDDLKDDRHEDEAMTGGGISGTKQ